MGCRRAWLSGFRHPVVCVWISRQRLSVIMARRRMFSLWWTGLRSGSVCPVRHSCRSRSCVAMVEPGRGAWTWAHLWMEVDELILCTEFDWDRRPEFSGESLTDYTCLDELERYPRDAEHIPEWLAQAVERARTTPPPPPPPDINAGARDAITEQERDARNRRNRDHD